MTLRERFELWRDTAPVDVLVGAGREMTRQEGTAFETHHVPPFTANAVRHGELLQMAECGTYVADEQIAAAETEPTCRRCRVALGLAVL